MTPFRRLLAKSSANDDDPSPAERLQGHTAFVLDAAEEIVAARGTASLRACGLPIVLNEPLGRIVRCAAFLHDLGKCSDHFQWMVRGRRDAPQLVRHEALSLWLAWPGQPLASWLRAAVETEEEYVISLLSAAGHHRKFVRNAIAGEDRGAGTTLTLHVTHRDLRDTLRLGAQRLGLGDPPALERDIVIQVNRRSDPRQQLLTWEAAARRLLIDSDPRLIAIAKALTLAADVAGSTLPRGGERPAWIAEALSCRASRQDLEGVVHRRLGGRPLRPFQDAVAASDAPVTLARAGCGTGKTVAAYEWAARHHAGRQLWFTYPTTGTATEGFRDYVFGPEATVMARLEHGRADVDLEILGLEDDSGPSRDQDRLDAIRAWGVDVVTCTVDTVLGLVQNQRKGLYAWPGLSESAVVFDEVHAYDDRLFGALLRFLEALPGIPALLMTASLPDDRARALRALVVRVHRRELAEVPGPADLELLPRYRRSPGDDPWPVVTECLAGGGKVLWVSNTVDRSMAVFDQAMRRGLSVRPLPYHSRYKYRDRVERHREVIDAFRGAGPALATTTQVAEMSLDLSADVLITDLAPVAAMIQRLGRLNRRATPDVPAAPKPFMVLPFRGLPYELRDLDEASRWLAALPDTDISQRALVDAWTPTAGVAAAVQSNWLDGIFHTEPAPVRDATAAVTVVLPEDARAVRSGSIRGAAVAIPMLSPFGGEAAMRRWPRAGCYFVPPARAIEYDPMRGARWVK